MRAVHCCNVLKVRKGADTTSSTAKEPVEGVWPCVLEMTVKSTERSLKPGEPLSGPAQASRRSPSTRP